MMPDPSMDRFARSKIRSRQQMGSARTRRSTGPTACAPDIYIYIRMSDLAIADIVAD